MSEQGETRLSGPVPSATQLLTFLIADVRGYTRFTVDRGDEAAARLTEQLASLSEEVVGRHGGAVSELRGDEVLAVFPSARGALRAAVELQERLAHAREQTHLPLNVGIGLDAGEVVSVRGGYRGTPLNLAARLCSVAGPGDVLASERLIDLARTLDGIVFRDRGRADLKGFPQPVQVFQVGREGHLRADLPPLQEQLGNHPNNLPVERTPFIGRGRELEEVLSLIHQPSTRLVTLAGTGGSGKTRLAVQVGAALLDEFPDGVFFVSLGAVADSDLVTAAIAQTLEVPEEGGAATEETLRGFLRGKKLLLVLDNFEQVRGAAPVLGDLLAACPSLRILVTSRAVLNLYGEYVYEVPPMTVPDPARAPDPATFLMYEAVALFVERAQSVRATFVVTAENAPAIAEICRRLDGLPLAIELAAARSKLFPPRALLQRLARRLDILTGGARDVPERQQTLRGTIEWSYDLLPAPERTLFALLSVFAGGFTLESAEAVSAGTDLGIDVLDGVATLVENSLLQQTGDEDARFGMLETIREYALWQLQQQEIDELMRDRHARYFLTFGEEAEVQLRGAEQAHWMHLLDDEHDNLRAALTWFLQRDEVEQGLRLAGALWRFWWTRGYLGEGRSWLERLLAASTGSDQVRAAAINGLANIVWSQGDLDRSETLHREALVLREQLGDLPGIARSLNNIALVNEQRGKVAVAAEWYERALVAARESRDDWVIALVLGNLAGVMGLLDRDERATELEEESLRLWRRLGDRASEGRVLNNQTDRALKAGDVFRAAVLQRHSIEVYRELGNQEPVAHSLEGAAKILTAVGKPDQGMELWAAADALRQTLGQAIPLDDRRERDHGLAEARAALGPDAADAAWKRGLHLTIDEAEEQAMRELAAIEVSSPSAHSASGPGKPPKGHAGAGTQDADHSERPDRLR